MAVVPVTTSPPQQLMGWAGLPESQLWFIVLFRLVKAMLSSVNSSINPRGKELMFPNGHDSRLHFWNHISFHLNSQPLRNLCFYPSSLDNTQNLQHGTFCTLLTQIHLKLIKIEHQQKATLGQGYPQVSHFTDGKTEAPGKSSWPKFLNKGSNTAASKTGIS